MWVAAYKHMRRVKHPAQVTHTQHTWADQSRASPAQHWPKHRPSAECTCHLTKPSPVRCSDRVRIARAPQMPTRLAAAAVPDFVGRLNGTKVRAYGRRPREGDTVRAVCCVLCIRGVLTVSVLRRWRKRIAVSQSACKPSGLGARPADENGRAACPEERAQRAVHGRETVHASRSGRLCDSERVRLDERVRLGECRSQRTQCGPHCCGVCGAYGGVRAL